MAQPPQIFVSHSQKDHDWCRTFVRELRSTGADIWYDADNVGTGLLADEIERELRSRPMCIVVLSPAAVTSRWTMREVNAAIILHDREPSRIVLPVVAQKCDVPLLWSYFHVISGPEGEGIAPGKAAREVAKFLRLHNMESVERAQLPTGRGYQSAEEAREQGASLRAQGRPLEALVAYEEAITRDASLTSAWVGKADTLEDLRRHQSALDAYDQALRLDPNSVGAWIGKGNALRNLGKTQEALGTYEQALARDPNSVVAWTQKSETLRALGHEQDAVAAYYKRAEVASDRSRALDPQPAALAWNGVGNSLMALGKYDEAVNAYDMALALDSNIVAAWIHKGRALQELGREDEALAAYDAALNLNLLDSEAAEAKSSLLRRLGRFEEASATGAGHI